MIDNTPVRTSIVPGMSYRNAPEAIEWLSRVFGFEKHAVYPGPNNTILHAELTLGGGMIMLGSVKDNEYSQFMKQPDEIGGAETRSINLIVNHVEAVYARAKSAHAEILFDIETKPYGGRGFTCRDLEGRVWNVDTYDPWRSKMKVPVQQGERQEVGGRRLKSLKSAATREANGMLAQNSNVFLRRTKATDSQVPTNQCIRSRPLTF